MPRIHEKWHPKLRERIEQKGVKVITLAGAIYRHEATICGWMQDPERIQVADAIRLCEVLDIPLSEIKKYFTWEGIK